MTIVTLTSNMRLPHRKSTCDRGQTRWVWLLTSHNNVLGNNGIMNYLTVRELVYSVSPIAKQFKKTVRSIPRCRITRINCNRNLSMGRIPFKSSEGKAMRTSAVYSLFAMAADAHVVRRQRRSRTAGVKCKRKDLLRDIRRRRK